MFLGNCHAPVYGGNYARWIAPLNDDEVTIVISYDRISKEKELAIKQADVIVNQIFDARQRNDANHLAHNAEVVNFPNISAGFLWPYSSEPHINNKPEESLPAGPFVRDLGDRFLNRFLHRGVDPEEALQEYINHDPVKVVDRFYMLADKSQRSRDELAGGDWQCADFIRDNFRKEWLFFTHNHPNLRLAAYIASEVYRRLGVGQPVIDRVIGSWGRQTPFARWQAPIHPAIARHLKLEYISESQTFESFVGELETFEQYCRRYLAYSWNRDLATGIELAKRPENPGFDIDRSIDVTLSGLRTSTGSAIGELSLAHLLLRAGRADEATEAAARACSLDRNNYRNFAFYGQMLLRCKRSAEALDVLRPASQEFPGITQIWDSYSLALFNVGDFEGSLNALKKAAELDPMNKNLAVRLRAIKDRLEATPAG